MKSTGIVRKVDQLGRIVIPKELRRALKIVEIEDLLEIYVDDGTIVLKKILCTEDSAGVARKVDQLGRIVLPIELRRKLDIVEERDALEIFIEDDTIVLKKYMPACIFCSDARNIYSFKGKNVCMNCIDEIKEI